MDTVKIDLATICSELNKENEMSLCSNMSDCRFGKEFNDQFPAEKIALSEVESKLEEKTREHLELARWMKCEEERLNGLREERRRAEKEKLILTEENSRRQAEKDKFVQAGEARRASIQRAAAARRIQEEVSLQRAQEKEEAERRRERKEEEKQKSQEKERVKQLQQLKVDHFKLGTFLKEHGFSGANAKRHFMFRSFEYPLHAAVTKVEPETIRVLIAAGADPELTNSSGRTPAQLAWKNDKFGSHEHVIRALGAMPCEGN
jgi:hypothetical protein